jgi:hypothetical protein
VLPFADGVMTAAAMQTAVENAYANDGGWVPMLFHRVCHPAAVDYATCRTTAGNVDVVELDAFLTWAKTHSGVSFNTVTGALGGSAPPPDTTAPAVTISAPANGATVTTATPQIRGTGGTAATDDKTVSVRVYSGTSATGAGIQNLTASIGTNGAWSTTPAALADGTYTVRATQRDAAGNTGTSNTVTFTVKTATNPPVSTPTITALSRTVLGQGARRALVELTGEFDPTSVVRVSGAGVRSRVVSRTATSLELRVNVGSTAAVGSRHVSVTNADGGRFTCETCLRVVKGPRITAVLNDTLVRGRTTWVAVRGSGFGKATSVKVGGKGVKVRKVTVLGPRRLKVLVYVAPGARRTARAIIVTDRRTLGTAMMPRTLRIR